MRFFVCMKGSYRAGNFDPIARRLTKLKPNVISNEFSISQDSIDEIDSVIFYFKGIDYKTTPNPIAPERTKTSEVEAE